MPPTSKQGRNKPHGDTNLKGTPAEAEVDPGKGLPFAGVFESAPQALALWRMVHDKRGRPRDLELKAVNKAFRELYQRTEPIPPGITLKDINPDFREWDVDILALTSGVLETGAVDTGQLYHARLGLWFEFTVAKGPDELLITLVEDISERRETESALERLRFSLDHMDDYCIWVDSTGKMIEVSESACRRLGYGRDELLQMKISDVDPDLGRKDWAECWEEANISGTFRRETRHRTKADELLPVEIAGSHMSFGGQEYDCVFCRDITQRRLDEQALRDSEELHRHLVELESDAIILAEDDSGAILQVNQAACDLYGYTRRELGAMRDTDVFGESEQEPSHAALAEGPTELWHRRRDGTTFPIGKRVGYLEWKGKPVHVTAVRDISEQKRAGDDLEESQRMMRLVLDTVPSLITWQGLDGRYLGCNAAAAADAHVSDPSEVVGLIHRELPVHNIEDQPYADDAEIMSTGVPRLSYEETVVKSNGETKIVRSSKVPLRDREGNVIGLLGIHDDVTERAEIRKALKERDEQLLQAQKMEAVGRLAGGIAHDFNNVLTTIIGYSDLILSSPDCPEGAITEDVAEIREAAERAGALTQRILAFSRRQTMEPRLISLNTIVSDTERLLARTIGADIELKTSLAPDLAQVEVDEQQFVQVLLNLAVNARDAMPKGGTLTIGTADVELDEQFCETHPDAQPGPHVMLTVTDTGSGMAEEVLSHVFEPFYTTKPPGLGTGLGLATVYGVVTQSGGYIYVHSSLGRGTTFTMYLPRAGTDSARSDQVQRPKNAERPGRTIMVADSDAPFLTLSTRILERQGFRVLAFSDGKRAAETLRDATVSVDVLITDLALSGTVTGERLAELAEESRPGLPVVLTSADAAEPPDKANQSHPDSVHLEKPFTAEELTLAVRTWLEDPGSTEARSDGP